MNAAAGVTGILTRINDIGSRFAEPATRQSLVVDRLAFDPFGAQYQSAVAALGQPVSSTTTDPFLQSYAPVPTGAMTTATTATNATIMTSTIGSVAGIGSSQPPPVPPTTQHIQLAIDGIVGAPGARPVGGYGKIPVPAELAAYGNGQVPRDRLVPIGQGGHRLWAPAAASWQNLVAAAEGDGITLKITDSYRSYDEQVDLAGRKGLYQNGGLAAVPGTSNHGWGMAVDADIRDPATMDWLRVNGPRFGWVEAVGREPWHWEFRPSQV